MSAKKIHSVAPLGAQEPLRDFMARIRLHRSAAHEKVRAQLASKGSFVVMLIPPSANYHGLWKTITRSTRPGVNWQVTSWAGDPHGAGANPIGHVDITGGAEEAAREIEPGAIARHESGQNPRVSAGNAGNVGNVGRSEKQTMAKTTTTTISALNDARACAKINAIRLRAGNPGTSCPSCGHSAYAPYSRSFEGKRIEGCIDAFHHGHTPPGYSEWYGRQTARELRRETLRMLERLGGSSARSKASGERAAKHERGQNPAVKIADMKVLRSFLNKQEAEGKKLSTDGRRLDGNWLGGSNIAEWKGDKMHLHDTGSRAGQAWQKKIQAALPDSFFTEDWMRPAGWKRRQAERAHSAAHAAVERQAGRTEPGLRRQDYRTAPELQARIDALVGRKK